MIRRIDEVFLSCIMLPRDVIYDHMKSLSIFGQECVLKRILGVTLIRISSCFYYERTILHRST